MSKITPKKSKKIFTDDILNVLPKNNEIKRGVKNKIKGEDPAYQEKISKTVKHQWQTKDQTKRIKNIKKTVVQLWTDPEYVANQKVGRAERYATPERCGNFKSAIIGTNKLTGKKLRFVGAEQMRKAGFDPSNIYSCLCGDRKSHKGYTWSREEK